MKPEKKLQKWIAILLGGLLFLLAACITAMAFCTPRLNIWQSLFIGVSALLIAAGIYMAVLHQIRRKLLEPFTETLDAGDWIMRSALGRPSDLQKPGETAGQSSAVQQRLDAWLEDLKHEYAEEVAIRTSDMRRDLELARDFQEAMLERPYPAIPDVHIPGRLRLEFHHCYKPASALGGDFYNLLQAGRDAGGVFIADVMGHGTRSALITSILRTLLVDLLPYARHAPHFLSEMNRQFCDLLKSIPNPLFASAFYFVADTTSRIATYSSAGHPSPFHLHRSVGRVSRLEVPPPRGAALGVIPDESFSGGHCRLVPDDVFLFFTDGVYEAFNRRREEFGMERMEATLKKLMYKNVKELVDGLLEEVMLFADGQPLEDDLCVIALEITTKPRIH